MDKLLGSYNGEEERLEVSSSTSPLQLRVQRVFLTLFWHSFLGLENGMQWSIGSDVFKVLSSQLSIEVELFASPFNRHLNSFCSLLPIDRWFGSAGNYAEYLMSNDNFKCFEANPPFDENVFRDFAVRIVDVLTRMNSSEILFGGLIVYPWRDSEAYEMITSSVWFIDEIVLSKGNHFYEDFSSRTSIQACHNTFLLVVGNTSFREAYNHQ